MYLVNRKESMTWMPTSNASGRRMPRREMIALILGVIERL